MTNPADKTAVSTAVIEQPPTQGVSDLYRRATDVAGACRDIVLRTSVFIGKTKSRHVRVEGWQAIAVCHGCCTGAGEAERVYDKEGEWIGYKAIGYVRNAKGVILATGEGFVGFDETDRYGNFTWRNRPEYAGRAMAQTRAVSRACRGLFAHVLVLMDAGLSTTPAEEMIDSYPEPEAEHPERPAAEEAPEVAAQEIAWLREQLARKGKTPDDVKTFLHQLIKSHPNLGPVPFDLEDMTRAQFQRVQDRLMKLPDRP
jgi:hypothetical protein